MKISLTFFLHRDNLIKDMKLPMLFARTNTGAIQTWTIEVDGNKFRTHYGQIDGAIQITEWTVCEGKNTGKKNATSDEDQAVKEAKATWKKKKESGYFEKINDIDGVSFTEPMLAKNYDDYKDELKYPIYSQPKLDGIRCVVKKDGMWSRNGKSIVSAPHVLVALKPFFDKFPNAILDGELYADKFANDFNAICSLVKKTKPTPEDLVESATNIQYWVYDWIVSKTFSDRNSDITTYLTNNNVVRRVPTHLVDTITHLNELYEKYVVEGYEGQMVRTDGPYENKRSKCLLKRKEFKDSEFKILDIVEGVGNKSGMAGHMVFKNHKDIEFHSNIKGDRTYLRELLTNKNKLIGKSATVKYFNLTPGDELPRFPYVVNIDRENYE
jgi:DNA ligase-1